MIYRELGDVLKTHPFFTPGWGAIEDGGIENPNIARVSHVVICKDNGTPIYDQIMIEEKPGSIVLPYDTSTGRVRVGLVLQERPISGKYLIEVPRGFGNPDEDALQTAYRELFEETGLDESSIASPLEIIGSRLNPNTTYWRTAPPIIVARFKRLEEISNPRGDRFAERIKNSKPYTFSDIQELQRRGKLECGITAAALFHFGSYTPDFYRA